MDRFRKEIDRIDRKVAELLDQRFDIAAEIGTIKQKRDLPVLDEEREKEKAESFVKLFDEEKRPYAEEAIMSVMKACRKYQEDLRFEYALLGKALGHSLSPQVHRDLAGYAYGLIELEEDELDGFFREFPLKGASVTMPYKRTVMKYLDRISDTAKAANSVNTIVKNPDGTLAGYNTDYDGFRYTVERSGVGIEGKKCLIFGSGGVSGTVKKVLEDCGAGEVRIISRKGPDNYENLKEHRDAQILVNATPVGMYPNAGVSPVDMDMFASCCGVFDLIYNPLRTRFMMDAEAKAIPAFSGMEMLVAQAANAYLLFTGEDRRDKIEEVCASIRREQENIVIIGMPGSGKSVIGEKLAELTGKEFRDSDESIARMYGMTPEDIILTQGEEEFRKIESETIASLSGEGGQVIATGGGVVETEINRDLLRGNGRIVYIKRDPADLTDDGRPISKAKGIMPLYERRRAIYESWQDLTVDNRDVEKTARSIMKKLGY